MAINRVLWAVVRKDKRTLTLINVHNTKDSASSMCKWLKDNTSTHSLGILPLIPLSTKLEEISVVWQGD